MTGQDAKSLPTWIAFDAVGTLIFADPPVHLAYYRIGLRHGSRARPSEVHHRFRTAIARRTVIGAAGLDAAVAEVSGQAAIDGEACEREFWRGVVKEVLPDVRDPDACFEELFRHFAQPDAWGCFADAEEVLADAKQRGCRLAIASNFDGRLHAVMDGHPALGLIDRRIISSEVGAPKPEAAFFTALLDLCECRPEQLLFVGDDLENDVRAPQQLGIRAIHLDRSGAADGSIRSLTDLWSRV